MKKRAKEEGWRWLPGEGEPRYGPGERELWLRNGPDLADDAVQFAWMQMLRRQPDRDRIYGWLVLTARRQAWQLARERRREEAADGFVDPATGFTANLGERIEHPLSLQRRVDGLDALRSLAALPDRQRRVLARKVAGLTYAEIEADLGWSYTQVNRHLTRARRTLRDAA
jgi:RNA polymerase sigma factor (sigma-70 family)